MPPVPIAVMMWESAKLVSPMSARVAVGLPRSDDPSESHESSITCRSCRSAISRTRSQSGALPMRSGQQDRPGPRPDRVLDLRHVGVVGVGLDVDEHRDEPGTHERRDVGREDDRRRDHLVPRLEAEQLDGQVQRRRARVAHHAESLAEERRDTLFERPHVAADAQRGGPSAQHLVHGVDLGLVVHAPGVRDARVRPRLRWWSPCRRLLVRAGRARPPRHRSSGSRTCRPSSAARGRTRRP